MKGAGLCHSLLSFCLEKMRKYTCDNRINRTYEDFDEHSFILKQILHNVFEEEVWVSINEESEDIQSLNELAVPTRVAKLNILTRRMLDYDQSFFSEASEHRPEGYRPYFYSFIIYMDSQSDLNSYDKLREMGEKWFIASFSGNPFSGWHEYQGEIESSASPVTYRKHRLYISDTELDRTTKAEIDKTYTIAPSSHDFLVADHIKTLLDNVRFTASRVYCVGNANLIRLSGNSPSGTFHALYDVGYHHKQYPDETRMKYGAAVRDFKKVVPNVVFLSHWDDDHIMGCVYGCHELFDCPWFAPEITKTNAVNAKRLAAYLTSKNKLTIIERNRAARKLADIMTPHSAISFYLGENVSKNPISKENCGGMVIEIKNRSHGDFVESLFCGDVPYEAVKTVIWNLRNIGYDYLLVPHHGSNMNYRSLKVKKNAAAVVCGNGGPRRPDGTHRNALEAGGKGYRVRVTEDSPQSWIDLNLECK